MKRGGKADKNLSVLVAKNIKRCRNEVGLTQEEAAEKAKMHYKFYQRLESLSGLSNPTITTLGSLSRALNISIEEFFKK